MNKKVLLKRKPSITNRYEYYVLIDFRSMEKFRTLVNECKNIECQWYSILEADYSQKDDSKIFYRISDMFIPAQECTLIEVDSKPEDIAKMWVNVGKSRGLTVDQRRHLMTNAGAWSHSHVQAEAKPSGQDEKNWKEFVENTTTPKAMLIFNQKGDIYCRVLDPNLDHLVLENPSIAIESDIDYTDVTYALEALITEKKAPVTVPPVTLISQFPATFGPNKNMTDHQSTMTSGSNSTQGTQSKITEVVFNYMGKH